MRKVDFVLNFKTDWSNIEIEGVERIVSNYKYNNGEIFGADEIGFIYTSSSSYAMHSVDGGLYYESDEDGELEISHFAITESNMLIMVCQDEDENYFYFEIEPRDF